MNQISSTEFSVLITLIYDAAKVFMPPELFHIVVTLQPHFGTLFNRQM